MLGPEPEDMSSGQGWSGLSSLSQLAVTKEVPSRRAWQHEEQLSRQNGMEECLCKRKDKGMHSNNCPNPLVPGSGSGAFIVILLLFID